MSLCGINSKIIVRDDTLVEAVGKKFKNNSISDKTLSKLLPRIANAINDANKDLLDIRIMINKNMVIADSRELTPAGKVLLSFISAVEIAPEAPLKTLKTLAPIARETLTHDDAIKLANGTAGELARRGYNIDGILYNYRMLECDAEIVDILGRKAVAEDGKIYDTIFRRNTPPSPEFVVNLAARVGIRPDSEAYKMMEKMAEDRNEGKYWNSYIWPNPSSPRNNVDQLS